MEDSLKIIIGFLIDQWLISKHWTSIPDQVIERKWKWCFPVVGQHH